MTRRGFLFTLSVLLLLGFLVTFSIYYSAKPRQLAKELTSSLKIERAGFVADDLETDLNRLIGIGLDLNSGSPNTVLTLNDRLPSDFNRARLSLWEAFAEGAYARSQSSAVDVNAQGLLDANAELLFNNGLQYLFARTDENSLQLFVPGGDTNFLSLDINLFVNDDLNSSVPWTLGSGDTNVTLRYYDTIASNAFVSSGLLSSASANQYILRYSALSTDSLTITFGRIEGSDAALKIDHSIDNLSTLTRAQIMAVFATPSKPLVVFANLDLNYTQADMNLSRKAVLARG